MSSGAHADMRPEKCDRCRGLFQVLVSYREDAPDVVPSMGEISGAMSMSPQNTRRHLANLVAHRWVLPDRRTPVDGVVIDRPSGPRFDGTVLDWFASVELPRSGERECRTCRRILEALVKFARSGAWGGQVSMVTLADDLKLSERTVRMHARSGDSAKGGPGHSLVAAELVAFTSRGTSEIVGTTKRGRPLYVRRPDRFVLAPARPQRPALSLGESWYGDRAAELLDRCDRWFDPTHREAVWIVRLVGALLADGWQVGELEPWLNVEPTTSAPLQRPYLFAKKRLPKRGELPVRSMAQVIGLPVAQAGPMRECVECRDPLSRFAAPDVTLCPSCLASVAVA